MKLFFRKLFLFSVSLSMQLLPLENMHLIWEELICLKHNDISIDSFKPKMFTRPNPVKVSISKAHTSISRNYAGLIGKFSSALL